MKVLSLVLAASILPFVSAAGDQSVISRQTAAPVATSSPATSPSSPPESFSERLDAAEKIVQILAYIVGACWVYFNSFKGRTYRPRLEPKVAGELCTIKGLRFLKSVVEVKNVGLSKVMVLQEGTALIVLAYDHSVDKTWRSIAAVPALERHQWIEPGETVVEHSLTAVDPETPAVRVELVITSPKAMWEAVTVVL